MPRASPIQYNLNAGEWSPLLAARVDQERFNNSLTLCRNFVPMVQGGITRRPGTRHIYPAKAAVGSTEPTILVPFEFSVEQTYVLEVGLGYIRFFTQNGIVLDGNNDPYEIPNPWMSANELATLSWTQSADVMYFVCADRRPQKLQRFGPTDWSVDPVDFTDGPYLAVNEDESIELSFDGTDMVTASHEFLGGTGYSGPTDFLIRIFDTSAGSEGEWVWFRAQSINDTGSEYEITVTNPLNHGAIAATDVWRRGAWPGDPAASEDNFPTAVIFFEGRLWFGGGAQTPQTIHASQPEDFENFAPTDIDGSVNPDNAISAVLNSNQVNSIAWFSVEERGLITGTTGGEWIIRRFTDAEGIAPDNIQATLSTTYGSANVRPQRVSNVTLFVQRDTRTLRELTFVWEDDGFRAPDQTVLAEHLLRGGIKRMVYQQSPQKTLWVVMRDGRLLSFTYEREQSVFGWAQHNLGGTDAEVQSAAVIPSADALTDEVWLLVRRTINGNDVLDVEKLTALREGGEAIEDAWFVDAALDYDGSATDTVSGLTHLEGETVDILANGAVHPSRTVESGSITLDYEASRIIVGLGYTSEAQTQRIEAGAADGTAQGKTKRIHRIILRFFETVGAEIGPRGGEMEPVVFRTTDDDLSEAVPLFTGDKFIDWPGDYDREGQVYWRQAQPLPMTALAVMPQLLTYDGG